MRCAQLPIYPHRAAQLARPRWKTKSAASRPHVPRTKLPYLGEAFTASAAWNTIRARRAISAPDLPRLLLPVWGLNHQFGLLELENRK